MDTGHPRVVVFGTGAIGATVGGWLVEAGFPVTFVARPGTTQQLNQEGLRLYPHGHADERRTIKVTAVSDIAGIQRPDWLILAVKNYDLETAAREIHAKLKGEPTVIALQNGIENQAVLPRYFDRVVYGVMRYNAWRDAANVFGYERRGPILLGVIDSTLVGDRDRAVQLLSAACECRAEERIADAARCKMVLNLTNSISALVGFGVREIEDYKAFSRSVSHVMYEGMQILRRAGVQEVSMGRGATWRTMTLARFMPAFMTGRILRKGMRDMHITSMGQDVYLTKRGGTELESLNGHFLRLAEQVGFDARYNRALYGITKDWLAQPDIRPMHERELWAKLRQA
jgi:2-dehydropantoate 2-reductase